MNDGTLLKMRGDVMERLNAGSYWMNKKKRKSEEEKEGSEGRA